MILNAGPANENVCSARHSQFAPLREIYRFVHGHTDMQMPHVPSVKLITFPLSSIAF